MSSPNILLILVDQHRYDCVGADGRQPWEDLPPAWPHAFELFLDALNGQAAPLVTAREAAVRSEVMEAFYRGAHTQSWVALT